MKLLRSFSVCALSFLMVASIAIDCGKKGPTIEQRISALQEKGVPDTVLANVKLYLYQVNSARKASQAGAARTYGDSLKKGIVIAEAWYDQAMQTNKPIVEKLRKSFVDRKASLSGLQLQDADSLLKITDSLIAKNWLVQARTRMESFDTIIGVLVQNEEKAKEIRKKLVGTWKDVHELRPNEDEGYRWKAVETRIFKFGADGSFEGHEEMHGQTAPIRKEDWKFLSWGKYDLMGDTIYQFITREKCVQQLYHFLDPKTNKWRREDQKTYDSTITNGAKDRFITFDDLKIAFKKIK
ncbi:MAG: hypothetical protein JW913_11525 [Chitinispirillaceae bacterium]|nr:hypothetical protein [Chitinispirillaceae bacterium]